MHATDETTTRSTRRFLGLLAVTSLLLVGCGGGDVKFTNAGATGTAPAPIASSVAPPSSPVAIAPPASDAATLSGGKTNTSAGSCNGTIGAVSVDEVHVPVGATCRLTGTRVNSNVSIDTGATLVATGVYVDGDVEGQGARSVQILTRSTIGGNIQLQEGGSVSVIGTKVDGDVELQDLTGPLRAEGNTIGGSLQAASNSGGLSLVKNRINGDLQCQQNARLSGKGNAVQGNHEDQCSGL
jgi:hypothetical protein